MREVLTYGCVIVLVIPVFAYLLNGGLYIRDKVFIPFLPLLVLSDCYLSGKMQERENCLLLQEWFRISLQRYLFI